MANETAIIKPPACVCVCVLGQYLVGDVVDGDVVHAGGVALKQCVQVRSAVSVHHRRRRKKKKKENPISKGMK